MTSPKTLLSLFTLFFFHLTVLSLFSADDASVMAKLATNLSPTPSDWTGTDYCKWTGIRCDNSNRVTSINLSSRSLSGSLPSDLNQLTQLKTLSLWKNNLSGSLPSLANLTSLEKIILNGNNFTSIPSDFFMGLTNLQTMSLSDNPSLSPWTIPKDLTQSNSLSTFFASNANLVGSIPDFFYSFPSLQNLRLSYNNLTGPLPATLGSSEIQNLWLNNQLLGLSGTIDVLSSMTQISRVWLQANGFTGPIPDLSQCANLFDLQLRENQFTGVVPATLTSLPLLANVSLQSNKLQGPVPVFGNGVTVTLGTANSFCKSTPGPCDSQVTTLLEVAGAIGYPISLAESWEGNDACQRWTFITCDSQGKNVSSVNFGKQHFSGTISPAFANLTSLRALYLNDNNLSGSIPDSLTTLPQFQILDVSNNNLSGQVPVFPSNVKLTATGNLLLGENTTSDGGGSGGTPGFGDKKRNTKVIIRIVVIVGSVAIAMICIYLSWRWMAKPRGRKTKSGKSVFKRRKVSADSTESTLGDNLNKVRLEDLPLFSFDELAIATDEFHVSNKLGQGGFGPVYMGKLSSGKEIAVKRLSRFSGQGMEEFMNEVVVISQLQHRNLVRLLGCSVEREEKMLIYEYMPNKSLDAFLFDPIKQKLLDWRKRANIIEGIGRGLLYLHRDSRLRIIHRDLKTSNVLLDENLNPKISDFGMAKIFGGNQDQANTRRVVGTYGYMAPEYAMQGRFSEKSDVFSFGILLLEIVSGRKNTSFYHDEHCLSLLEFAWKLWNEDRIVMLIDSTIPDPCFQVEILRYIHVGLLCVQEFATKRPTISNVLSMLSSEIANLPTPKKPAFTETRDLSNTLSSQQSQRRCSVNNVTVTTIDGR